MSLGLIFVAMPKVTLGFGKATIVGRRLSLEKAILQREKGQTLRAQLAIPPQESVGAPPPVDRPVVVHDRVVVVRRQLVQGVSFVEVESHFCSRFNVNIYGDIFFLGILIQSKEECRLIRY